MLNQLVSSKDVILCVGSGGVGKTTTSASIGLHAAIEGKRVLVLTVDPAKRLANSLGLGSLPSQPTRIDPQLLGRLQAKAGGELWALMLDTKETFDSLIRAHAPDAEARERLLNSVFYEKASTALAGTHEFMAMEKLYEVHQSGTFDLVVLDTPPTAHALDFLSAPNKLIQLLDNRSFRTMMDYSRSLGRVGFRVFNRNSYVLKGISKFIGVDFLLDLLTFLDSFNAMYDGFQGRAAAVKRLFGSDRAAFVIVCAPDPASINDGVYFHQLLRRERMPFGCFIVNRAHSWPAADEAKLSQVLRERVLDGSNGELLIEKLVRVYKDYEILSELDQQRVAEIKERCQTDHVQVVPVFDRDIHDITTLDQFRGHLFSKPENDAAGYSASMP